jgi:hypothetical protein
MEICRPVDTFQNLDRTHFFQMYGLTRGAQNSRRHLQIMGARMVTRSKVHTEDPQILGATVKI